MRGAFLCDENREAGKKFLTPKAMDFIPASVFIVR